MLALFCTRACSFFDWGALKSKLYLFLLFPWIPWSRYISGNFFAGSLSFSILLDRKSNLLGWAFFFLTPLSETFIYRLSCFRQIDWLFTLKFWLEIEQLREWSSKIYLFSTFWGDFFSLSSVWLYFGLIWIALLFLVEAIIFLYEWLRSVVLDIYCLLSNTTSSLRDA